MSASTRDQARTTLCSNNVQSQTKLFTKQSAVIFVIDNYGETVKLLHQRSGRSATRLSGTHGMAIKVWSYTNTDVDGIKINIKYNVKHVYPSPVMMTDCDNDIILSDAIFT